MIPRSLRARVTTVGVITLALVLGVGAWVTARALGAALRSDINAQNEETLDVLAADITDGVAVESLFLPVGADGTEFLILNENDLVINASLTPIVDGEFPLLIFQSSPIYVGESGGFGDGAFIVESATVVEDSFPGGPLSPEDWIIGGELPDEILFVSEENWFETSRVVATPDGSQVTVVALSPFGIVDRSIDRLTITLSIIVPLLVVLGGAALWLATGAALRPVRHIADEANRIAPSTSGARLPVPTTGDEIAMLTKTLNGMLDRLDDGLTRQRQFISDASHELRSPLTAIKGAAELVATNGELPDEVQPSMAVLRRGADRLEAVLDDVTQLAEGDGECHRVEVDLEDLIAGEIEAARTLDRTVVVDGSAVMPAVVTAHRLQLSRAVHNLLVNGVRHANSQVNVGAALRNGMVEIVVDDDGSGVPVEDRERVFERFVRLDDARSRSDGGSGLGLAIVAAIAASHDGAVSCDAGPLGGARFKLLLPA